MPCKCLLKCEDEILVLSNFTSLALISTMIALLVILLIIKLYTLNNATFYFILRALFVRRIFKFLS